MTAQNLSFSQSAERCHFSSSFHLLKASICPVHSSFSCLETYSSFWPDDCGRMNLMSFSWNYVTLRRIFAVLEASCCYRLAASLYFFCSVKVFFLPQGLDLRFALFQFWDRSWFSGLFDCTFCWGYRNLCYKQMAHCRFHHLYRFQTLRYCCFTKSIFITCLRQACNSQKTVFQVFKVIILWNAQFVGLPFDLRSVFSFMSLNSTAFDRF